MTLVLKITKFYVYILSFLVTALLSFILTWRTIIYEYDEGSLFLIFLVFFSVAGLIISLIWDLGYRIAFYICILGFVFHYYLLWVEFPLEDIPIDTFIYTLLSGIFIGSITISIGFILEGIYRCIRYYINYRKSL
jgi:hypothetical protein